MTIKEFNQIKAATFTAAEKIPEIKTALNFGDCLIYELSDISTRKILTVNYKTQMNDSTIKSAGFNPETATVKLIMRLNRSTKSAEF